MQSPKTLDTLIDDIYALFDPNKHHVPNSYNLYLLKEGVEKAVTKYLFETEQSDGNVLRMSSIGRPARQLWYENFYNKRAIERNLRTNSKFTPARLFSFLYGAVIEELLLFLVREAGHTVELTQHKVELNGIKGSIDCKIDGVLVDVKSASFRSFEKFSKGTLTSDDPFGYISQISGYAKALGEDKAAFFAMNKENGELALMELDSIELRNVVPIIEELKVALEQSTPPARCYDDVADGASGNRKLAMGCTWCPYKWECWKDSNRGRGLQAYEYANGLRYLTHVSKEPLVENVTDKVINEAQIIKEE